MPRLTRSLRSADRDLRRVFRSLRPKLRPRDAYDWCWTNPDDEREKLYIRIRQPNGATGVVIDEVTFQRLTAYGPAAIWALDALIPVERLKGVAHVHVHHRNPKLRRVVFRVVGGHPAPPRWCGRCAGPL